MKVSPRDKITLVQTLDLTADQLISALLHLSETEPVSILDSCGVGHLGAHLLIAGIEPVEMREITNDHVEKSLAFLDEISNSDLASIFTISYDFGLKMHGIKSRLKPISSTSEPDVFIASFDVLIIHDYDLGETFLTGDADKFASISCRLLSEISNLKFEISNTNVPPTSNFTKTEYLTAIENIKERIRCGDTYQTNLTQQLMVELPNSVPAATVFSRLRKYHPSPFSAFIQRTDSKVVSASPERFFRVESVSNSTVRKNLFRTITTSPIKGTRPRGATAVEDNNLRTELLNSPKDRAENTMIVDLLRNDLGRICEYGSVRVEKLCDLEEHPTLFHLVSTVSGRLRNDIRFSDILRSVFPCGSITGAPKISTMKIIDEIETADRGLSMGAIGVFLPSSKPNASSRLTNWDLGLGTKGSILDLSVAIRTMIIRDSTATFNVGGGVVIDSYPETEYEESMLKAKALLTALGCKSGSSVETEN